MFNKTKIKYLREEVSDLKKLVNHLIALVNNSLEMCTKAADSSKAKYVWELRQEEIDDIRNGRKVKKIRKILE